jgi:predicted ArsR family transcriptional regulator
MQETRQQILEILRELGQATVDDIVEELCKRRGTITAVTVRHHLARLQQDKLIGSPELRHRDSPGRPQHIYSITPEARAHFPNNYTHLVTNLLKQLRTHLPPEKVTLILDSVVESMVAEAQIGEGMVKERVQQIVLYLNEHGYGAEWAENHNGFVLRVCNCPYYEIQERRNTLCQMDMKLIASSVGITPEVQSRASEGGTCCIYLIPAID